jgi:hypothetical protein
MKLSRISARAALMHVLPIGWIEPVDAGIASL